MSGFQKHKTRLALGILLSVFFLYLALRKVDFGQMWLALKQADYFHLLPAVAVLFISHLLRAFRWRYLLDPIRRLDISSLFSSLIIGYAANVVMPAHLGEFLRSYVASKKNRISMSSIFATIVTERVIDVFSLLSLMLLAILLFQFPAWVARSGYIMLFTAIGLSAFLILLKTTSFTATRVFSFLLKQFPKAYETKIQLALEKFLSGFVPLRHWHDYITVAMLSLLIWACYGLVFHFALISFHFSEAFRLNWSASLILLIITTIAVVVPSSPGYVGTYHYLCQISLAMFAVPAGPALSFATVVHALNFLPVFVLGLFLAQYEGATLFKMQEST